MTDIAQGQTERVRRWTIYVANKGTDEESYGSHRVSQQHKPVEVIELAPVVEALREIAEEAHKPFTHPGWVPAHLDALLTTLEQD